MDPESAEAMLHNAGRLIDAAQLLDVPVLVTEQYPKGLGHTEDSLAKRLKDSAKVFEKTGFSSCAADGFVAAIEASGRKQIVIAGQETHVCVLQTALELAQAGYHVHVAEDAVCSRKSDHKRYALQRMQAHGITVTNYESVLFEWLRDAKHPHFKAVTALLR